MKSKNYIFPRRKYAFSILDILRRLKLIKVGTLTPKEVHQFVDRARRK